MHSTSSRPVIRIAPLALVVAVLAVTLCGCGSGTLATTCTAGTLASSSSTGSPFTLVPASSSFSIYPGQTTQVMVTVQAVGGSTGVVTLGSTDTPQGITVSPTSAAIGSTVPLGITASNDVVSSCFTGVQGVFTAGVPLSLTASTATANSTAQVAMNVVLENPTYVPATPSSLPVLTINTDGAAPIIDEDDYLNATMTLTGASKKSEDYTGPTEIKGHGHSTWIEPKKPYRLNLPSKASLLGMTSDTNWILLANYDDKSLLRNDLAFQISNMFGMFWTPNYGFVELYLNGQYEGNYMLTEEVQVSKARLDIGSLDDTNNTLPDLSGGYLGEMDHYLDATDVIYDRANIPIDLADPDPPTPAQVTYFLNNFGLADISMFNGQISDPNVGWRAYWDETSEVNYFLIEELAQNQDADDWSSDYFYKPRNDPHWYRGPVWDMDITFGNDNYGPMGNPSLPWVATNEAWYRQLLTDPYFVSLVKARWAVMRAQMLTLPAYIDAQAASLAQSQANNFARWPILGERIWPNNQAAGSYQGEIDFLKSWLTQRIAYMDAHYTP